ncbi:MAG: tetratricopeptide repeat protein, partial [Bacteroidetes bacterium]|nr:tetratricopeptide repeat protein [Bacteroidota bacterium]
MFKRSLFFLLVSFSFFLKGQISVDTINRTIDTTKNIRKKITKIYSLSKNRTLTPSDLEFLKTKMLDVAAVSAKKSDKGFAYYQFAVLCSTKKKHNEAIKYGFDALKIAEQTKDTALVFRCLYRLGVAYKDLNNIPYSKKYFYNALNYATLINNDEDLVSIYNYFGTIYKNADILDSALFYNKKALVLRLKLGDKKGIATTYNNIGLVYKKQKNYDLALTYLQKALTLRVQ